MTGEGAPPDLSGLADDLLDPGPAPSPPQPETISDDEVIGEADEEDVELDDVDEEEQAPADFPRAGDYELVARFPGSEMTEVYLAHKTSKYGFLRRAVVKRANPQSKDFEACREMLLDEARALAWLDHMNVVAIIDLAEDDSGFFLAIEHVDGTDLRRVNQLLRTRGEALPFELACFMAAEILRGLHHAHAAKDNEGRYLEIVHRDVNPANVLISTTGHIKLTDFGVVRMRDRLQDRTKPGIVKGKYGYLAPEYILGKQCDYRVDIYGVGIMLLEALTGRPTFSGVSAHDVMKKIVDRDLPLHRLEREGVPEDLRKIVERAVAGEPADRFASAEEMANALETWVMRSRSPASPWILSAFFTQHGLFDPTVEVEPEPEAEVPAPAPASPAVTAREPAATPVADQPSPPAEPAAAKPPPLPPFKGAISKPEPAKPAPVNLRPDTPPPAKPAAEAATPLARDDTAPPKAAPDRTPPPLPIPEAPTLTDAPSIPPGAGISPPPPVVMKPPKPASPPAVKARPAPAKAAPPAKLPAEPISIDVEPIDAPPPLPKKMAPARDGELKINAPADVLAELVAESATGIVEFSQGPIWKKIVLIDGHPADISSNIGMEMIGEQLVKAKLLSRADLDRALRELGRGNETLVERLVNRGLVTQQALAVELGKDIIERLADVMKWRSGTFAFAPSDPKPPTVMPSIDFVMYLDRHRPLARKAATPSPTPPDVQPPDVQPPDGQTLDAQTSAPIAGGGMPSAAPSPAAAVSGMPEPSVPPDPAEDGGRPSLADALRMARQVARTPGKGRVDTIGSGED